MSPGCAKRYGEDEVVSIFVADKMVPTPTKFCACDRCGKQSEMEYMVDRNDYRLPWGYETVGEFEVCHSCYDLIIAGKSHKQLTARGANEHR